jgi:pimeloyl-ACP methyl ester carboxylesterase
VLALALLLGPCPPLAAQAVVRTDMAVASAPGTAIYMREVMPRGAVRGAPVLLIHGARVPSVASFDLPVAGGSLAADLAAAGLRVFLMDVRGYGRSTRPARMNEPPVPGAPLVRSSEAVEDIDAVVEAIRQRTKSGRVALVGWAAGGHWAGLYATRHHAKLSALVLYNTIYGGGSNHPGFGKGSDLEDAKRPGTFNRGLYGAWRWNDAASLLRAWDASIPVADKSAWRDPRVAEAYVREALASDPESARQRPPAFRAPTGALADTFEIAAGGQAWDAGLVQCRTLIVSSERDFWSRAEDRERLQAHLVNAGEVKVVLLPGATHFAHLDRPARGRSALLEAMAAFLTPSTAR